MKSEVSHSCVHVRCLPGAEGQRAGTCVSYDQQVEWANYTAASREYGQPPTLAQGTGAEFSLFSKHSHRMSA